MMSHLEAGDFAKKRGADVISLADARARRETEAKRRAINADPDISITDKAEFAEANVKIEELDEILSLTKEINNDLHVFAHLSKEFMVSGDSTLRRASLKFLQRVKEEITSLAPEEMERLIHSKDWPTISHIAENPGELNAEVSLSRLFTRSKGHVSLRNKGALAKMLRAYVTARFKF